MTGESGKTKSNLMVELRLVIDHELTWGELLDFVSAAQRDGELDRDETIVHERSNDAREDVALIAWISPDNLVAPPS